MKAEVINLGERRALRDAEREAERPRLIPVNYMEFRIAVEMALVRGITFEEIARPFGMNEATAKRWHIGTVVPASIAQAAIVKWIREEIKRRSK